MADVAKMVAASLLVTFLLNLIPVFERVDLSYPTPKVTTIAPPVVQAEPTSVPPPPTEVISTTPSFIWNNLDDAKLYGNDDYSEGFKRRLRDEKKPCFMYKKDRVQVIEHQYPHTYIKVLEGREKGCEGWTTR